MGCLWSITYNSIAIDSGNQNCHENFLQMLLSSDFTQDKMQCTISSHEMAQRLEKIGYSECSIKSSLIDYTKKLAKQACNICFLTEDYSYIAPEKDFWQKARTLKIEDLSLLWEKVISNQTLEPEEKYIHDLITNNFIGEEVNLEFDWKINYYIIATISRLPSQFTLEFSELIDGGYWSASLFQRDRFNELLAKHTQNTLIRYSAYLLEEDLHHEFKEIKGKNPASSIKQHIEKYVLSFINAEGGDIIFGVSDDRVVIGFEADVKSRDDIRKTVISIINNITPPIHPDLYQLTFINLIENGVVKKDVVCFNINIKPHKINDLYKNRRGQTWIRQNGASIEVKSTNHSISSIHPQYSDL